MIENRQFRFDRSQLVLPDGIEATVGSEEIRELRESVEGRFHPDRSAAVRIVSTGIGRSIGGYARDAVPATRLLASTVDYLVTNSKAVNASDFIPLNDNFLYTEGYCIDLLYRNRADLHTPFANSIGVIIERSPQPQLQHSNTRPASGT